MIIVDSSVWIDYFNGTSTRESTYLDSILGKEILGIGDLILVETLQGFKSDTEYTLASKMLNTLEFFELLGRKQSLFSVQNYRRLRQKGFTIRKTVDVVIASFCIANGHSLLFSDRDFEPCVDHLGLKKALPQ